MLDADNGHEALALFADARKSGKESPFDLVVLDMIMEDGFDGLDTFEEIRKLYPEQKVLICSGYTETERVKIAQRLGADWLPKPYQKDDLVRAVRRRLDRS